MAGILGADGGFAQYLVAPEETLVAIPDAVPFEQAAPLMCAGVSRVPQMMRYPLILCLGYGMERHPSNRPEERRLNRNHWYRRPRSARDLVRQSTRLSSRSR
jgi:hypothetical protein